MFLNRDSVSDDELQKFAAFLESLPETSALRGFLTPMYEVITNGGGIFVGHMGGHDHEHDHDGPDQRPPGIYPPE